MLYFVVNPTSSSGRGLSAWNLLQAVLDKRSIDYECRILTSPEDTKSAADELSRKTPCTIVIVGGDGSLNQFLRELPTFRGITFGYIPTGSGNDFARGMGISSRPVQALERILKQERELAIDIGMVRTDSGERCFAVSSGFGFDAAVCYAVDQDRFKPVLNRLHLGKMIYTVNALKSMLRLKPYRLMVRFDDGSCLEYDRTYFIAAMNNRYEGGGFLFAPKGSPSDGQLDFMIVSDIPKWKALLILPTAFFGKHVGFRGIHMLQGRGALLSSDEPQCIHTDGEHVSFADQVRIFLHPERLKIIL